MNTIKVKGNQLKNNPNNPRYIKDNKFKLLVDSLKEFPEMLDKRPLVCYKDENDKYIILGGNMRLKALKEANIKEIPILLANEWTEDQRNQFIIKDNLSFGEWDWDVLANEWNAEDLSNWGLDVWVGEDINLDDFFEEDTTEKEEEKNKIVLEYNEEDYNKVINKLDSMQGSKEEILFRLLEL